MPPTLRAIERKLPVLPWYSAAQAPTATSDAAWRRPSRDCRCLWQSPQKAVNRLFKGADGVRKFNAT